MTTHYSVNPGTVRPFTIDFSPGRRNAGLASLGQLDCLDGRQNAAAPAIGAPALQGNMVVQNRS
jgi:hypothetical protein